jgi:hypothetical protein
LANAEDTNILGHVSFDNYKDGKTYSPSCVKKDFGTYFSAGTLLLSTRVKVVDRGENYGKAIKVKYPKGKLRSLKSGASWHWKSFGKHKDIYLSYWVKFKSDFVFKRGGKLHGLCGGKGNTGGKKPTGHDGWSSRVHWGPGNKIKQYVYHKDQAGNYGQSIYWVKNPEPIVIEPGKSIDRNEGDEIRFTTGVWHYIVTRVVVNDVGKRNGLVQSWLDGDLVLNAHGFEFRDTFCSDKNLLIDDMYFSTFFGGNSKLYKPDKIEYAYFDDFRVSRKLFSPPEINCEKVKESLIMKLPQPRLYDAEVPGTNSKYGYGMRLEWLVPTGFAPEYYEIQFTTDRNLDPNNWITYQSKRSARFGVSVNHHGDVHFGNYTHCLPSAKVYFYRVRAFDVSDKVIGGWSNVVSGNVSAYRELALKKVKPKLFDGDVPNQEGKKYGYGIRIEWTPALNKDVAFYEIQFTTNENPETAAWTTLSDKRSKEQGSWINHHGNIVMDKYVCCLPSSQTFFYRVRALGVDKRPLIDWCEALSGAVENYSSD